MKMKIFVFGLLIAVSGCEVDRSEGTKMPQKNLDVVENHCIGRHAINIPKYFKLSDLTMGNFKTQDTNEEAPSFNVVVREKKMTHTEFISAIEKRRLLLKKKMAVMLMSCDLKKISTVIPYCFAYKK